MSRLCPQVTEENRIAYLHDIAEMTRRRQIAKWLKDNPDIGVLNMGNGRYEYYRSGLGKTLPVNPPVMK